MSNETMELTVDDPIYDSVHRMLGERVERGMAFLDDYFESNDWVNRIDLESLELESASACVCGQLFDEYAGKTIHLKDGMEVIDSGYEWAALMVIEHGVPWEMTIKNPEDAQFFSELSFDRYGSSSYLGFNINRPPDIAEEYVERHDFMEPDDLIDNINRKEFDEDDEVFTPGAWEFLTYQWKIAIEKRRAELGTL